MKCPCDNCNTPCLLCLYSLQYISTSSHFTNWHVFLLYLHKSNTNLNKHSLHLKISIWNNCRKKFKFILDLLHFFNIVTKKCNKYWSLFTSITKLFIWYYINMYFDDIVPTFMKLEPSTRICLWYIMNIVLKTIYRGIF